MKSYEINILCDTDGCDSIETSEPWDLVEAEQEVEKYCTENGWEIQGDNAVCPKCIEKLAKEQNKES